MMGGRVSMAESLRFADSVREVTIAQDGGRWFLCTSVQTDYERAPKQDVRVEGWRLSRTGARSPTRTRTTVTTGR